MKVLHLSTDDSGGGAARGAYWLHRALREAGADSHMLVQRKHTDDPTVSAYEPEWQNRLARRAETLPLKLYRRREPVIFSPATLTLPVQRAVNALTPDIVNLHWVNGGFLSPESLAGIRAPIVWTLRDLWPMTGGCHYAGACDKFTAACGACPALGSPSPHDLSAWLHARKRRAWRGVPITLVALSHWLAGEARRSSLFSDSEIAVIPNALDVRVFRPSARAAARAALGLPPDKRLVLFGAMYPLGEPRKGFAAFQRAARLLAANGQAGTTEAVVFGDLGGARPDLGLRAHYLGALTEDATLALAYAAADVTVMPSLEEAFGKIAMESLACGTPVVCFDGGGPADIVDHLENGYLARSGDAADLAAGVETLLNGSAPALARAAVAKVRAEYTFERQAQHYTRLYGRVLGV